MDYFTTFGSPTTTHKDGISWYDAKVPRRWHRCQVQTHGEVGLNDVDRCACGAIRMNGSAWMERNSKKRD